MLDYKEIQGLIKDTLNSSWISDRAQRTGAALAFYTLFQASGIFCAPGFCP